MAPPTPSGRPVGSKVHPETGFPLIDLTEGTTLADIHRAMDDEDVRVPSASVRDELGRAGGG